MYLILYIKIQKQLNVFNSDLTFRCLIDMILVISSGMEIMLYGKARIISKTYQTLLSF